MKILLGSLLIVGTIGFAPQLFAAGAGDYPAVCPAYTKTSPALAFKEVNVAFAGVAGGVATCYYGPSRSVHTNIAFVSRVQPGHWQFKPNRTATCGVDTGVSSSGSCLFFVGGLS